jgi:hypothetical protein
MLLPLQSLFWPSYHNALIDTAKRLLAEKQPEIATVTAHMACEIRTEQLFAKAFAKSTFAHLEESVRSFLLSYSLANDRIRRLYTALTTDDIESQPFWSDFKASAKRRNDAVYQGVRINLADAQLSCTLAEQLITHLDRVAAKIEPDRNVK